MIFENEHVEELCLLFKRNRDFATFHRICDHLTNLMHSIVRRSRYQRSVPFNDLMSSLYNQVDRWVLKWRPGEGKFYTYAATSVKHGCISCVARESNYRSRFQNLGDSPIDLLGSTSSNFHTDESAAIARCLTEIEVRWVEPEIREAIRVILVSVLERRGESRGKDPLTDKSVDFRRCLLNTLRLGYDMDLDTAKFLLDWTTGAVRNVLLTHFASPLSAEDIIRLGTKYSFVPDLVTIFGINEVRKMMFIFAGTSIRFPTMMQMKRSAVAGGVINTLMNDPQQLADTGMRSSGISESVVEGDVEQALGLINSGLLEDSQVITDQDMLEDLVTG